MYLFDKITNKILHNSWHNDRHGKIVLNEKRQRESSDHYLLIVFHYK